MYVRQNCIYCATPLVDRHCPTCEGKHFVKAETQLRVSETDKGKPRKPGPA